MSLVPKQVRLGELEDKTRHYAEQRGITHSEGLRRLIAKGLEVGDEEVQSLTRSLATLAASNEELRDRFAALEAEIATLTSALPAFQQALDAILTSARAEDSHRALIVQSLCEMLTIDRLAFAAAYPDTYKQLPEMKAKQYALFLDAVAQEARKQAGLRALSGTEDVTL